jgi:predicted ATP-binding protein involved in virulence
MEEIFLKSLKINKVRHLGEIDIQISENERKHLILTGKNGSGKTSVLEILKEYFEAVEINLIDFQLWESQAKSFKEALRLNDKHPARIKWQRDLENTLGYIEKYISIVPVFQNFDMIFNVIKQGQFMFAHFPAQRGGPIYEVAQGPKKLTLDSQPNSVTERHNHLFLQYLVNLKTERSFARDENDELSADTIDKWFVAFENVLKQLYGEDVKLAFDRKEWNFYLLIDGYERFDLNHLSDGYAAIISIISELLLRMEKYKNWSHDMQGIVLIDEIETHLHIELQKKVLPFLTAFFPKLQFIVTTHSPFVLSSVNNAVIFDLEKRERVEDLSGYSVENIIETYFDADQYSELLNKRVKEYEELSEKTQPNTVEVERLRELEKYFQKFPLNIAPELSLKLNTIRLKKIA